MDYKKAVDILIKLLEKPKLQKPEKEALMTAIGVLDWVRLGRNRMKNIIKAKKDKKEKDIDI